MIEGYKKLLNDLNMHIKFKEAFTDEYKYNQELFNENMEPGTRKTISHKPIDRVVADLRYYENLIYIEDENIKHLETKIKEIDECINESDITVKVSRLRALGLTQEQVAELVERSPRQVQRIEAKICNE